GRRAGEEALAHRKRMLAGRAGSVLAMRWWSPRPGTARSLTLVVVLVALAVVCALGSSDAQGRETSPAARVTFIGDSVAGVLSYVKEARQYLARGLDLRLELRVCRRLVTDSCWYEGEQPPTAPDVVRAAAPGELGA